MLRPAKKTLIMRPPPPAYTRARTAFSDPLRLSVLSETVCMHPEEGFHALIDSISHQALAEATDLYTEDAVVEHPNATSSSPVPRWLRGKSELRELLQSVGQDGGLDVGNATCACTSLGTPQS